MKVSIIVPVYNTEKYLKQCLDSILSQSYKNIELILINDGSTDNSLNICREYTKDNTNIVLIDQQNQGVSHSRNVGIQTATGDYILFVDSDDIIEAGMIELLMKNINNNDLLVFGYYLLYTNAKKEIIYREPINNHDKICELIISDYVGGLICNKMFKKSIIDEYKLRFDENIHYCEDMLFIDNYLKYCSSSQYINIPLYDYRMRNASASWNFYNKKNTSIFVSYNKLLESFKNNDAKYTWLCINYIFNYYRLKSYIDDTTDMDLNIINNRKKYLSKASFNMKIKIWLCKNCLPVFKLIQKTKSIRYHFYK